MTYEIFRLQPRNFRKCGNIWSMRTHLCDEAKCMGYREMSLGVNLVNARARHLYEKHGFEVIREGEDQYGKFVKMLKNLEQKY